jgi:hypothetical protein
LRSVSEAATAMQERGGAGFVVQALFHSPMPIAFTPFGIGSPDGSRAEVGVWQLRRDAGDGAAPSTWPPVSRTWPANTLSGSDFTPERLEGLWRQLRLFPRVRGVAY